MKINSNTIKLEKESYQKLENIIKKIASENKIENVENIEIKLSKNSGVVKFAGKPSEEQKQEIMNLIESGQEDLAADLYGDYAFEDMERQREQYEMEQSNKEYEKYMNAMEGLKPGDPERVPYIANDLRNSTIYRNQFKDNYEWGVMLHTDGISIYNFIIENNFIDNYKGMCLSRQAGNFISLIMPIHSDI